MIFFMLLPVILLFTPQYGFSQDVKRPCRNPSSKCVLLKRCTPLMKKIQADEASAIIQSICDLRNNPRVIKVCCPKSADIPEKLHNSSASGEDFLPKGRRCGKAVIGKRIIGGSVAPIRSYAWMAALFYTDRFNNIPILGCSATVISSRYLLTAAHCVHHKHNRHRQLVNIRIGDWNLTNPGVDCIVHADKSMRCRHEHIEAVPETVIFHPEYSEDKTLEKNDIALIRINKELDLEGAEGFIMPVCIPHSSFSVDSLPKLIRPTVTGWGRTENQKISDVLLEVDIPLVNKSICKEIFGRIIDYSVEKLICAGGEGGKDSCFGDSGGPLFISNRHGTQFTQIGLLSIGTSDCGLKGFPAMYTDISKYRQWIVDNLKP